jgi:hypothetical protein
LERFKPKRKLQSTEQKQRIVESVRTIERLRQEAATHWDMVCERIKNGEIDDAITLLNAYYRLKEKLNGVDASLQGTLRGYFADK